LSVLDRALGPAIRIRVDVRQRVSAKDLSLLGPQ